MKRRYFVPLTLVLLTLLVEGAARLAQPWLTARVPAYYYRQYLEQLFTDDPVFVWKGKSKGHAEIANSAGEKITYDLNSLGWRDKEFNPIEMVGNALILGDSFTFGLGVPYGKRYTELLENGFRGLDIWNLGAMGYAPDQYLLLAVRWLPPVPWNFVLVQLSNNDLADVAGHGWAGINPANGIPAELTPPFSHSFVSKYSEAWNLVAYFGILGTEKLSEERLGDGLKRLLFSLREIAKLARLRNVPMLVLQATDWGEPQYGKKIATEYRDGVIALAKEQGFGLLEAGSQELLPAPDLHWTAASHYKVAELLVPAIHDIIFPEKPAAAPKKKRK